MLYLIHVGNDTDLLLTENGIVLNCFSEHAHEYNIFVRTVYEVANHFGGEIEELETDEKHFDRIEEMFDELDVDGPTKHIAEYILSVAHPK